jgi:hypothetical protein
MTRSDMAPLISSAGLIAALLLAMLARAAPATPKPASSVRCVGVAPICPAYTERVCLCATVSRSSCYWSCVHP